MLEALEIAAHRYSYRDLAETIRRFGSDPLSDLRELFRRMAFNILVGSDDDHLRNHAFLFVDRGWRLSPLYDVVSRPPVHMGNPQLRLVTPATANRTVTPRRVKNSELRSREYLTEQE